MFMRYEFKPETVFKLSMKKKLITTIILMILPLSGCGIISIGYNYADVYLRYTINSYADFNDAQKQFIRQQVDLYMLWNRKAMLPEYVKFLQELQHTVQSGNGLKKEDVTAYRIEARALYVKTLQPTVAPAAALLSEAEPQQIEQLVHSFAGENKKQRDKELSGDRDEQLRKRAERTIDFIENLVGNFSDDQLGHIRDASRKLPFASALYLQMKEDNQTMLIELMKQKSSKEKLANFLSLWLMMPEKFRSPEEQNLLHDFELASDQLIVDIYTGLSERQKNTLLSNIGKYIDSFQNLSRQ